MDQWIIGWGEVKSTLHNRRFLTHAKIFYYGFDEWWLLPRICKYFPEKSDNSLKKSNLRTFYWFLVSSSYPGFSLREACPGKKSQNCGFFPYEGRGGAQPYSIAFGGVFPYITEAILVDEISTKVRIYPPEVITWHQNLWISNEKDRYALLEKKTPISVRRCGEEGGGAKGGTEKVRSFVTFFLRWPPLSAPHSS